MVSTPETEKTTVPSGHQRVLAQYSRFTIWLEEYQNHLWSLSLFPSWNKEDVTNDFLDIMLQIRKRFLQNPQFDGFSALNFFWLEWNKRGHQQVKNKGKVQLWVPLMLFGFKWPLGRVAQITGWSLSHIRFITLETLRNLNKTNSVPLSLSRDCLRSDLFVIEHLLGETWNDAFQVFGPKQLSSHLKACPRCSKQLGELKEAVGIFKNVNIEEIPRYLEHSLTQMKLPQTRTQAWTFEYRLLGFFPKLVIQFSIFAFALFTLLNVPFVGEIKRISALPQMQELPQRVENWWKHQQPWISQKWTALNEIFEESKNDIRPETDVALQNPPAPETLGLTESESPTEVASAPSMAPVTSVKNPVKATTTPPLQNSPAPVLAKNAAEPVPAANASAATPSTSAATAPTVVKTTPNANAPVVANEKIFLRWGAFTNELDEFTPKILEVLSRYSAEMAGDLTLGAEYRGGRYFHFRIPTEHRELLKKEIAALKMKNFYVDSAKSNRNEIPGKIRIVFLVRPHKN